jgi:hypothetical protein
MFDENISKVGLELCITKQLTYCTEQSPSEAKIRKSGQDILRHLWTPYVRYRVHKSQPGLYMKLKLTGLVYNNIKLPRKFLLLIP